MTDSKKLREKMDASGYRMYYIASRIGLSYQGMMNKVNNVHEFTAKEIKALCDLLGISSDEKETIFFASK